MFKATIKSNKTQVQATFYVSEGTVKHTLMGKFTAFDLGILQIKTNQLNSSETEQFQEEWHNYKQQKNSKKKNEKVQHMEYRKIAAHLTSKSACKQLEQELETKSATQKEKIDHIIKHFDAVYEGICKHRYREIKLHIDQTVNPVIQPQRRIPFARKQQLEELLIELEEADVIERVDGPTNWVSNIVITPKSDPSKIRMNVDMTAVNNAFKRTRHVIPTVEELRYQMNGSAVLSKLDMNHGYN